MANFILHIGRHKTGTSSLQKFLSDNRTLLKERGYHYPFPPHRSRIAHHDVASIFGAKRRSTQVELDSEELATIQEVLRDAANSRGSEQVLLSSEGFQNAVPTLVGKYFEPGRTKIIVYIREQVEYLISAYQQKVQANQHYLPIQDSVRGLLTHYDEFLLGWEKVFGRENLKVRVYARQHLKNQDVVVDFLDALGISDTAGFSFSLEDQNPSIGGSLLEFKRHLNACNLESVHQGRLYRVLSAIASNNLRYRQKPYLKPNLVEDIRQTCAASNRRVFDKYFGGEDVFSCSITKPVAPVKADYAADVLDILNQLRTQDPLVFAQISNRLRAVLPELTPILRLQKASPELNVLSSSMGILNFLNQVS